MDLLHFKISKYGISIASRILGTEISLNNSDEYLGAGFLKIEPINSQTRRISTCLLYTSHQTDQKAGGPELVDPDLTV